MGFPLSHSSMGLRLSDRAIISLAKALGSIPAPQTNKQQANKTCLQGQEDPFVSKAVGVLLNQPVTPVGAAAWHLPGPQRPWQAAAVSLEGWQKLPSSPHGQLATTTAQHCGLGAEPGLLTLGTCTGYFLL